MLSAIRMARCIGFIVLSAFDAYKSSADDKTTVVERSVSIASRSETNFVSIDIGELPAGVEATVLLSIGNVTNEPFKIKKISLGCSCMTGKAFGDVIEPGKSIILEIKLKVPSKSQKETMVQTGRIDESDTSRFQFGLVFRLRGVACFRVESVGHNLPYDSDICEFKVPILFTSPSEISDILVKGTGDLSVLSLKVIVDRDEQFICYEY